MPATVAETLACRATARALTAGPVGNRGAALPHLLRTAPDVLMFATLEARKSGPLDAHDLAPMKSTIPAAFASLHRARLLPVVAFALCCVAPRAGAQLTDIHPNSPLPTATSGQFYSVVLTPVNPYKGLPVLWNITPGCLNGTGLFFNPQNGNANSAKISGVPNSRGTFACTIMATDAGNNVINKPYELTIVKSCFSPRITSDLPPPADGGAIYRYLVTATGTQPRIFSALGLPPGLTIDPTTGLIAGTPTAGGAFPVTIIVKGCGRPAIQSFTFVVGRAPVTVTLANTPNPAVFGQDIAVLVHAGGGATPPSGTMLLCVLAPGEFCAAPAGAPPPGTAPGLIPPLRSATLDATGNATFTLSGLPIQNYVLQAYYGGDGSHDVARSVPVDQFVIKGAVFPPPARAALAPAAPAGVSAQPIPVLSLPMLGFLALAVVGIGIGRTRRRG